MLNADGNRFADRKTVGFRVEPLFVERVADFVQDAEETGVGMALVAAGGVLAGIVYAAREQIGSVVTAVYQGGKRLLGRAIASLASMMPSFVFGGT